MAKRRSKTLLAFGDVHVPYHDVIAVEVMCRAAERMKPDIIVCLGDLLDCSQFSAHPPTYGVGNPVEWTHGFVLGFLGRRSDTLYSIPIMGKRCILPDGTEIAG